MKYLNLWQEINNGSGTALYSCCADRRGTVRKINQDSLTVKVAGTAYGEAAIAIICDGMGGLEQGEVASATVAKTFEQWFLKDFPPLLESGITLCTTRTDMGAYD